MSAASKTFQASVRPSPLSQGSSGAVLPPLALLCAANLELADLRKAIVEPSEILVGRKPAYFGLLDGTPVLAMAGGVGMSNTAHATTALLESGIGAVVNFGIGGAYPGSGLTIGDIAIATASVYGDCGVDVPGGWLGMEQIGFPLYENRGERSYNIFENDSERVQRAAEALGDSDFKLKCGRIVTVANCSGTAARGRALEERFGAISEGMEGAAAAHVCAIYQTPFLEIRAISNFVEDRDLSRWNVPLATSNVQKAVRMLAKNWQRWVASGWSR